MFWKHFPALITAIQQAKRDTNILVWVGGRGRQGNYEQVREKKKNISVLSIDI